MTYDIVINSSAPKNIKINYINARLRQAHANLGNNPYDSKYQRAVNYRIIKLQRALGRL